MSDLPVFPFLTGLWMTFQDVEKLREAAGVSAHAMCIAAGIRPGMYYRARAGSAKPRPKTLQRWTDALKSGAKLPRNRRAADDTLRTLFRAYAAILAPDFNADPTLVVDSDPKLRANADPVWALAAKVRAIAVYCVVVELDVPAARVAAAIGVTRQAASTMLRRVEELRDDQAIDALVERVGALVNGREQ